MTCSGVKRAVMRFPFLAPDGDIVGTAIPNPGSDVQYGSGPIINTVSPFWTVDPLNPTYDIAAQRISIPDRGQGLRAIAIAPDSAIYSCDIAFGGNLSQRYRVSGGNPLIGDLSGADFALVSIPAALPSVLATPLNSASVFAHDGIPFTRSNGAVAWGFPLRLELWYGDTIQLRHPQRSPLYASMNFLLAAAATTKNVLVITDGRKRMRIEGAFSSATTTVKLIGCMSQHLTSSSPRIDGGLFLNTLATITSATPSVDIPSLTPWPSVFVQAVDTAGAAVQQQVILHGWDD